MPIKQKRVRPKKSLEINKVVEKRIKDGTYAGRLPGIDQLAAEFAVNRKTVNRAIIQLVQEGLLVRRSGYGTFVAENAPGKVLTYRQVNTRRYAFLVDAETKHIGYLRMLDGCDKVISAIGGSIIYNRFNSDSDNKKLLGRLRSLQVEGVFVCAVINTKLLEELKKEFNVLVIDYDPERSTADSLTWDNCQAGYEVATRLIKQGCRHFSILVDTVFMKKGNFNTSNNNGNRLAGIVDAVKKQGATYMLQENLDTEDMGPFIKNMRENPDETAFIYPFLQDNYNMLIKLKSIDLIDRLRLGSFCDMLDTSFSYRGVFCILDTYKLGHLAATLLTDNIGRPQNSIRKEVLAPEFVEF